MSIESSHCLLCYYEVTKKPKNVTAPNVKENNNFGRDIDLIKLCDILRVSVNQAEKFFVPSVSLCMACDTDIREIKKYLSEIKLIKRNISSLMKGVQMKLETSFGLMTPEDHKTQFYVIRNDILLDISNMFGFTMQDEIFIKTELLDRSADYENDFVHNSNDKLETQNKTDDLLTDDRLPKNVESVKEVTQSSQHQLLKLNGDEESLEVMSPHHDKEPSSGNDNSDDPDFCGNMSSDSEESDEEYFVPAKKNNISSISPSKTNDNGKDEMLKFSGGPEEDSKAEEPVPVSIETGTARNPEVGTHGRPRPNVFCVLCDKYFHPKSIKRHIRETHKRKVKLRECKDCGKILKTKQGYNLHILTHSETADPHICSICGKHLGSKQALNNHEKNHNRKEVFSCEICHKKWKTAYSLKLHMESHATEPKYTCDQCGKAFKYTSHFLSHLRLHKQLAERGEIPYNCDQCNKTFKTKNNLTCHKRHYHPAQKIIHQCNICGKILSRKDHLRTHQKTHEK